MVLAVRAAQTCSRKSTSQLKTSGTRTTGSLRYEELLRSRDIGGGELGGHHRCHTRLSNNERFSVVSNYTSGSFALFRVREDGGVGELTSFVQHQGCGAHTRQEGPHAHCGYCDAADAHSFVVDLGTDEVKIYAVDEQEKVPRSRH